METRISHSIYLLKLVQRGIWFTSSIFYLFWKCFCAVGVVENQYSLWTEKRTVLLIFCASHSYLRLSKTALWNLPYIWIQKPRYFFRFLNSCFFIFSPNEYAGLCVDIEQGVHRGKNKVARNEKRNLWIFCISKLLQIFKYFTKSYQKERTSLFLKCNYKIIIWITFQDFQIRPNIQYVLRQLGNHARNQSGSPLNLSRKSSGAGMLRLWR